MWKINTGRQQPQERYLVYIFRNQKKANSPSSQSQKEEKNLLANSRYRNDYTFDTSLT